MIKSGKLEISEEYGCYCLYRLVKNINGEIIKKVLVMNTHDLSKAIIKMVQQIKQQKG